MNIFFRLNGSLLTAVAIVYSISITWNFSLRDTDANTSNISLEPIVRGTFVFQTGNYCLGVLFRISEDREESRPPRPVSSSLPVHSVIYLLVAKISSPTSVFCSSSSSMYSSVVRSFALCSGREGTCELTWVFDSKLLAEDFSSSSS